MMTDPGSGAGGETPTVLCPRGHVNAWDYKFCGECGLPLGVVAWPSDEPAAAPTNRGSHVGLLITALALVVISAVVIAVIMVVRPFSHDGAKTSSSPAGGVSAADPVATGPTTCPQAPVIQAESVDLKSDGLAVSAAFRSACADGDLESNSALEVTVAAGQRDIAAGRFDFSAAPLVIGPGEVARRTLVFPPGMYWRTPNMFSGPPDLVATQKGTAVRVSPNPAAGPANMVAISPGEPAHGSTDSVAEGVLAELRSSDFEVVQTLAMNRWVAQVSSKRVGLVVNGKTFTNADILQDHLAFRQRFSGARLVWSGNWTTFSAPNFWVTVVGPPYHSSDDANSWCDANGFGVDDCFAKFLSTDIGVEGTTVYRK
jgi:hypothetical protein